MTGFTLSGRVAPTLVIARRFGLTGDIFAAKRNGDF